MIHSFADSPAFRDHPVASIVVSGNSKEILSINKAAKKLFGERKSTWVRKEVREFLPDINFLRKNLKSDFIFKGKSKTVSLSYSKLKFANSLYYLIAITRSSEDFNLGRPSHTESQFERIVRRNELSNSIINSLPGVFYLIDETGKFLRWNENFENVTGYSGTEISKMQPTDFFEEGADRTLIAERVAKVFIDGQADAETDFLTKTKSRVPHYFTGKLINFEGKNCLIGMGIDVTRRREAELLLKESEHYLLSILNSSTDATYFMDLQGRIKLLNAAAVVTANVLTKQKISVGEVFLNRLPDQWKESFLSNFQRV